MVKGENAKKYWAMIFQTQPQGSASFPLGMKEMMPVPWVGGGGQVGGTGFLDREGHLFLGSRI